MLEQLEVSKRQHAVEMQEIEAYVEQIKTLSEEREALTLEFEKENDVMKSEVEKGETITKPFLIICIYVCIYCKSNNLSNINEPDSFFLFLSHPSYMFLKIKYAPQLASFFTKKCFN